MDLALRDLGEYVQAALPEQLEELQIEYDELAVVVRPESIVRVLSFLRDDVNCQFKQLMDVCGVDHPGRPERFEVVYNLLSLTHNRRIRVKLRTDGQEPVPTVTGVFSSAGISIR